MYINEKSRPHRKLIGWLIDRRLSLILSHTFLAPSRARAARSSHKFPGVFEWFAAAVCDHACALVSSVSVTETHANSDTEVVKLNLTLIYIAYYSLSEFFSAHSASGIPVKLCTTCRHQKHQLHIWRHASVQILQPTMTMAASGYQAVNHWNWTLDLELNEVQFSCNWC